jgi:hypothetical protein
MGPRITIVRAATKETAENIVDLLMAEKAYQSLEIEPEAIVAPSERRSP